MRNITIGYSHDKYPKNIIRNQRYRWYTFPFLVFAQQFRYFFNIYFFAISFSQLFSRYSVSPLISNILPWTIVICVSLFREGVDDYKRYKRDMEANSQLYTVVRKVGKMPSKTETKDVNSESHILNMKSYEMKDIPSSEICVGDIIILSKNRRVPADCVLLSAPDNTIFIRTDQLDGETDWKSKIPVFQNIPNDVLFSKNCTLDADSPHKDIYSFVGTITDEITLALDYQNVLWMDTVLASNQAICVCIYTGSETRAVMNTMTPKSKLGLIDEELNFYSKFLLALSLSAAIVFTVMRGVVHRIDATVIRFLVIFSSVVPISLKVSIDGARYVYTYFIQKDIDCVVRNSSIPEELGRISYLLSDKTGTLTCNEMEMKKVHIGTLCYTSEMKDEIQTLMHKKICNDNRSYDSGGVHDSQALSNMSQPNNESSIVTASQEKSNITNDIEKTGSMTENEMQSGKETMQNDYASQQESMMSDYASGRDSNDERNRDSLQTNYASEQESHITNSEQETWNSEQQSRNDNEESQNDNSETWNDNSEMDNSKQKSDNNTTNDSADFKTCNNNSAPSSYESCSGNGSKENLQIKDGMAIDTKAYVESEYNSTSNNNTEEDLVIPSSIDEKYLKSENTCNSCSREDNLLSSAATNSTCQNSSEVPSSAHETARNTSKKKKKDLKNRVYDLLIGLSLCHNVTPVIDNGTTTYQASSPDEVAIVKWTESVGIKLIERSAHKIVLWNVGGIQEYKILHIFPFTSDSKRMGIVIEHPDKEIYFYQKGADVVMKRIVKSNDWLEEETDNMAREGLRTLIIGSKRLNSEEYDHFCEIYTKASNCVEKRSEEQAKAVSYLENDLNILGLTGVEDKLQDGVKQSLENLRNAGIKVWMLTGDKIETATCIAISSKLFSKTGSIKLAENIERREDAYMVLQDLQCNDYDSELKTKFNYLIVDGKSIQTFMQEFPTQFIKSASYLDAVVFCRCSPTQKADIALLLRKVSKKRVACIGDGGNDVSMITAADVGIGIVGKEGKQASLAADFSLERFKDVCTLFLWHGRNCYKGTAKLANLIIHRGTIISVMQAIFCSLLEFSPFTLYQGTIIVLYVTLYTFLPVFASIFSTDTTKETVYKFPELYRELNKSSKLSFRAFATWNVISFYQGAMIILLSCVFFKRELFSIISITFSSLIVNELLMVILSVDRVTKYLVIAEVLSLFFYVMSFVILKDELIMPCDLFTFLWKVGIINLAAISFTVVQKIYNKLISPSSTAKLTIE